MLNPKSKYEKNGHQANKIPTEWANAKNPRYAFLAPKKEGLAAKKLAQEKKIKSL